jgi:hypothetical protein
VSIKKWHALDGDGYHDDVVAVVVSKYDAVA